ncbi:MAG: hypothetical protein CME70_03270 [Halobacteriovorax sp.]|nr:hypothetical protein [Halobacteriovorax sp.]MBK23004.1 hypothetical protein [Halobacteriovorax sp.]|tara:strand:- start:64948 stop:65571 length:624 start_codon:yes stop_codon:yes gene_type:complete
MPKKLIIASVLSFSFVACVTGILANYFLGVFEIEIPLFLNDIERVYGMNFKNLFIGSGLTLMFLTLAESILNLFSLGFFSDEYRHLKYGKDKRRAIGEIYSKSISYLISSTKIICSYQLFFVVLNYYDMALSNLYGKTALFYLVITYAMTRFIKWIFYESRIYTLPTLIAPAIPVAKSKSEFLKSNLNVDSFMMNQEGDENATKHLQ